MIEKDVFEHVGDAICCLTPDWRVIDLNPAAVAFLDVEPGTVLGQVIWDRPLIEKNEALRNALVTVMQNRSPLHVDLFLPDRKCWTDARIFPLAHGGVGVSWRDISEYKQREAALLEAVEHQEMLFRELTHGVTNSLQEIASRFQLEARCLSDPAAREICKRLASAIRNRSLVYSRLYSSSHAYAQDLGEYVRTLCEDLAASLPEKIKLTTATERGTSVSVAVATTVGMVIAELIANAGKHAWPPGFPGRIEVAMRRRDSMIEIEFNDDGCGIQSEAELFASGGLGMKLIQTHARRLKGRFSRIPMEGGAAFLFCFPVPVPDVVERAAEMETAH